MPIKRIQQTVPLRILDWQRCVGLFLEGFSLLCELHGAQVPEGRVEPLVVVPPHVPVDVRAQLLHVRVDVPVDELLPDEPVGGFDHRVVVWVAGSGKGTCDAEHVEHAFDAFPGELAAAVRVEHLDLIQREAQRGERGQHEIGVVPDADRMAGDLPVGQVAGQADVRPRTADPRVGRVGGQMGARRIAIELAGEDVGSRVVVRPGRAWPIGGLGTGAGHAVPLHDPVDAAAGERHALMFQGVPDLPGPVHLAAVPPHALHILLVRVGALGLGVFEHPVAGRLGNAQNPALRRYRAAAGVGPYHACFRANTGAACSETSTSISSCLSRFRNSISSFSSGVRLSAAFVEPLLRIPCTQRRSVERGMPYSALICDDGLPFPLRLHDLPLELLLVMTGTIRIGHDDQLLRCHVPHEPVQYIVANPVL